MGKRGDARIENRALRKRLLKEEEKSPGILYERLSKIDNKTASMLHPNDTRRIVRALEVWTQAKIPMSELKKKTKGLKDKFEIVIFCLSRKRQALYKDIENIRK